MTRPQLTRVMGLAWVMVGLLSVSARTHPHDEREIFTLKGTLTKVDAVTRAIEMDTFDSKTKTSRNLLLFVDRKVKLRNGKARMNLEELTPGQRVTCEVERNHKEDRSEQLTAFEIRLETRN
jgi:hypothetical protein